MEEAIAAPGSSEMKLVCHSQVGSLTSGRPLAPTSGILLSMVRAETAWYEPPATIPARAGRRRRAAPVRLASRRRVAGLLLAPALRCGLADGCAVRPFRGAGRG